MPAFLHPLYEEFSLESFQTWAKRKFSGYASSEVDYIARKVNEISTQSDKHDILARLESAIKDAREKLSKATDTGERTLIGDHIIVLNRLKSAAEAYDPIEQAKKNRQKEDEEETARQAKNQKDEENKKSEHVVRLDA